MIFIKLLYNFYLYTVIILLNICAESTSEAIHGRYTRDITKYQLSVPKRVSESGELISFSLPQFYEHDYKVRYKRDSVPAEHMRHYNLLFDGADHHIELWPNHAFVSPDLATESFRSDIPVANRTIRRVNQNLCHYVGHVRGHARSTVALSLCDGLAGYITTNNGQYFIEPLAEHQPNYNGEHVHVVYKRDVKTSSSYSNKHHAQCGITKDYWTKGWEDAFRERLTTKRQESDNLHSHHRYLETLVVCDNKFLQFHKNTDIDTYVMTIMNMVANFYRDASAGNLLDVVVVRIMYLEREEEHMDLMINPNAEDTLESFCKWQNTINPADIQHPQHHDIAVLLTRHDICSDNLTNCDLMGLAFVATPCTNDKPCAINEDSGIPLGITVAHEMGHVMGCSHDNNEDSSCGPQTPEGDYYIMAPFIHMATVKWSTCSRKFITELFESNLGECLNDEPQESLFKFDNMPPGSVYDAEFQCNLLFPGSTLCRLDHVKFCEKLYCKTKKNAQTCTSNGEPPADGTKCGQNMWCYNEKCVEIGQRPRAVDGGWGNFGEWSQCSRTCGGGIQYAERDCNNPIPKNRGKYCIGERKKVKMCNTNACPEGAKSFRTVQCTEMDAKPFNGRMHTWKPFDQPDDPCSLYCINEQNTYAELAQRVKDGTNCKRGTKNKCIFGVCKKVGCDWVIDSKAVEDQCGVCNGDGTDCTIQEGLYSEHGKNGYTKIVHIPKGATNIIITEDRESQNTLAASNADGTKFFLNGDYSEARNGDYDIGGAVGLYDHPETEKETLVVAGPLKEPVIIYAVFYNTENPGFRYRYAEPLPPGAPKPERKPSYNWEFLEFGDCPVLCGGGIKVAQAACVEKKEGRVADHLCNKTPKPDDKTMKCNEEPCKHKWRAGGWGKCSGCKFRSGVKIRAVDCVKEKRIPGEDDVITDESQCVGPKPATRQLCCSNQPCPKTRRFTSPFDDMIADLWYQINRRQMEGKQYQQQHNENEVNYNVKRDLSKRRNNLQHSVHKHYEDQDEGKNQIEIDKDSTNQVPVKRRNLINEKYLSDTSRKRASKKRAKVVDFGKRNCPSGNARIAIDKEPPEEIKVFEVPIKQAFEDEEMKLSDAAFSAAGDSVVDELDACHETVYTGKQAVEVMKQIARNNNQTE